MTITSRTRSVGLVKNGGWSTKPVNISSTLLDEGLVISGVAVRAFLVCECVPRNDTISNMGQNDVGTEHT